MAAMIHMPARKASRSNARRHRSPPPRDGEHQRN
jgi:hypothetical protein